MTIMYIENGAGDIYTQYCKGFSVFIHLYNVYTTEHVKSILKSFDRCCSCSSTHFTIYQERYKQKKNNKKKKKSTYTDTLSHSFRNGNTDHFQ